MATVKVIHMPSLSPAGSQGWRIETSGAVEWRGTILILWPGKTTDLASVPKLLRPLIDDDEPGLRLAAMLHDAAYRNWPCFSPVSLTRREADAMLFDVAVAQGLPAWKAWLVWYGVRLFGWRHWKRRVLPRPCQDG